METHGKELERRGEQLRIAKEASAKNEAHIRAILESAPDAIITIDAGGVVREFNPAAERIFGYESTELVGRSVTTLMPPSFSQLHKQGLARYVETGERRILRQAVAVEGLRKDGTTFPLELTVDEIVGSAQRLFTAIGRDITERKRAENELRKLSIAVEQSPASVVITNLKGTIEYVNPMFSKVTGYTAEEAVGRNPRILKSGKWPSKAYEAMWDQILAGEVWTGEFQNKKKNGELYWEAASISPVRNAEGEIVRFVAVKLDITKSKLAEAELCRLSSFPEANPHPILEIQPDGRVSYCNPSGLEMLERLDSSTWEPKHLLPKNYQDDIDRCIDKQEEVRCPECELEGRTIGWTFRSVPGTNLVHAYGRDITNRKQAEKDRLRSQEVEQERNLLRGAVKAQERLLGVVGHELRTPLAGVRAMAELLIDEGSRDMEEFDVFLRNIHDEVVRMSGMVNDLLEVARLHSGAASWNWSEVSLQQACEAAVSTVRALIDQDKLELNMEVHPAGLMMRGDKDGIRRLVLNLLNNACKNTPEGSIYILATGAEHDGHALVNLTVGDTGTGMTPEVAQRLGQAFALNSGVVGDSHVKGSGLGLAICRGIATAHGGTISVKSAQGQGSMFTALLRADLEGPMSTEKETQIECEVT